MERNARGRAHRDGILESLVELPIAGADAETIGQLPAGRHTRSNLEFGINREVDEPRAGAAQGSHVQRLGLDERPAVTALGRAAVAAAGFALRAAAAPAAGPVVAAVSLIATCHVLLELRFQRLQPV